MSSSLSINTSVVESEYVINAVLTSTDIPVDIFMYENTGDGLGAYQGVCTLQEYKRLQFYAGVDIPVFGNKFLRWNQAVIHVPLSSNITPTSVSDKLVLDVRTFKTTYLATQSSTQIINI